MHVPCSSPNPHGSHLSLNKSPGSQSPQGSTFFDFPDFGYSSISGSSGFTGVSHHLGAEVLLLLLF